MTRRVGRRVARLAPSLVLAASAAGISYALASALFAPREAFFAPIAAVICVGTAAGQRLRRAAEIVVGVTLGLLAADLVAGLVSPPVLALALAVLVATALAAATGAGNLMSNQAAVAAVLVVALSGDGQSPFLRILDALIGGTVALVLNAVFAPDPVRRARRTAQSVLSDLREVLVQAADALRQRDLVRAEKALDLVERVVLDAADLDQAIRAARENALLARHRRRLGQRLEPLEALRARLDLVVSTERGLARAVANAVRHGDGVPDELVSAVDRLAEAFGALGRWIEGDEAPDVARGQALEASERASAVLDEPHDVTAGVLVGQVRSATVDLLRVTGLDQREAVRALEEAAGRADRR